ncbi:MAG: hypothetical protein IJ087_04475 [Eggerthellaceae bacterium]|nr:hypothetical protein [Eggerthellaceae bacterium]
MDEWGQLGACLKALADEKGAGFLRREAWATYQELAKRSDVDPGLARLALTTLLADPGGWIEGHGADAEGLESYLEDECFLSARAAARMAQMYSGLFSAENMETWNKRRGEGLRAFCSKPQELCVEACSVWDNGSGSITCSFSAAVQVEVADDSKLQRVFASELDRAPFIPEREVRSTLQELLQSELQGDFDEYVNAERYYEPYVYDYAENFQYVVDGFCDMYGLKPMRIESTCDQTDFEPDPYPLPW